MLSLFQTHTVPKLNLIDKIKNYNRIQIFNKILPKLKDIIKIPRELQLVKSSSGCLNPVHETSQIYHRVFSILLKVLHRPRGLKKLKQCYSRIKKSSLVRPPIRRMGSGFFIKTIIDLLLQKKLIKRGNKGLFTSREGIVLIKSCLD